MPNVLFIWLLFISSPLPFEVTAQETTPITVQITEQGFEPQRITILPGTAVVFENTGQVEHWPASDHHPSHTLYDGTSIDEHCQSGSNSFDACLGLPSGDSWTFVFETPGEFTYHDHVWPHLTGEVVVQESTGTQPEKPSPGLWLWNMLQQIVSTIMQVFVRHEEIELTSETSHQAKAAPYVQLVIDSDPQKAIHTLSDDSKQNPDTLNLCHELLHEIGRTAYQKYGNFSVASVFQHDFCNSGYIHGVFEAYFESTNDPFQDLTQQCRTYAAVGGRPFDLWQCYHGVGHGLMYLTGGDLRASLSLCQQQVEPEGLNPCQNGVFMEVFNAEVLAKEPEFVNAQNPLATCTALSKNPTDCYVYLPSYLSQTVKLGVSEMFQVCEQVEVDFQGICMHGIGSELMKRHMENQTEVIELCQQTLDIEDQTACMSGAVSMYMQQLASWEAGQTLCELVPTTFIQSCVQTVDSKKEFFERV